jgi:hypothetical protein
VFYIGGIKKFSMTGITVSENFGLNGNVMYSISNDAEFVIKKNTFY